MKRQKLTHIQHVFFDLDHTLWDFDYNSACVFEQIFEERGIPISVNEFIKVYVDKICACFDLGSVVN